MGWPTPQDYNEAMQNPSLSLSDGQLKSGRVESGAHGLPRPVSGAFASVYHVFSGDRQWALRCFLHPIEDHQYRYTQLSRFVENDNLECTVPFSFLPEGVQVRCAWYPIVKMAWVQGQTLPVFIKNNLSLTGAIADLAQRFQALCADLQRAGIAHGDLQHGNIMVLPTGSLRLVDYDGMYVPALHGLSSNELGHGNYQHPGRKRWHFGPYLDNFSAWVIYGSLCALVEQPELWHRLSGGDDCLLFRQADFQNPDSSRAFAVLEHQHDKHIVNLSRTLRYLLTLPVEQVPPLGSQIEIPAALAAMPPPEQVVALARRRTASTSPAPTAAGLHGKAKTTAAPAKVTVQLQAVPGAGTLPAQLMPAGGQPATVQPVTGSSLPASSHGHKSGAQRFEKGAAIAGCAAALAVTALAFWWPSFFRRPPFLPARQAQMQAQSHSATLEQAASTIVTAAYAKAGDHKAALYNALKSLAVVHQPGLQPAVEFYRGLACELLSSNQHAVESFTSCINQAAKRPTGGQSDYAIEPGSSWPTIGQAYFQRGKVYFALKQYDRAVADYSMCIALLQSPQAYFRRALAYQASGRPHLALSDVSAYIRREPLDPLGLSQRADIERTLGQLPEAMADERSAQHLQALARRRQAARWHVYGAGWLTRKVAKSAK